MGGYRIIRGRGHSDGVVPSSLSSSIPVAQCISDTLGEARYISIMNIQCSESSHFTLIYEILHTEIQRH